MQIIILETFLYFDIYLAYFKYLYIAKKVKDVSRIPGVSLCIYEN